MFGTRAHACQDASLSNIVASATTWPSIAVMKPPPPSARPPAGQPEQRLHGRAATDTDGRELRAGVQSLVRGLGLLSGDTTPWGERLSISHAHALLILLECSQRGDKPTQHDLGKTLGIDKSNVARLCARMEAAGHATQERCRQDGRARRLAPTHKGLQLAAHVEESSRKLFVAVMTVIPPHARAGVLSALEALDAAVREVLKGYREDAKQAPAAAKKAK
jgi:DNA-binding MarR family transcriptional regulator